MKKITLIVFMLLTGLLFGHEFWIQPDKYIYGRGEMVNLKFVSGENFTGKNWKGNKSRVENLQLFFDKVSDTGLHKDLTNAEGDSLQAIFMDEGTVVVALQTKNNFIELNANDFNNYLKEDGLDNALNYRIEKGDTAKPGKEFYQRSAKAILQIGNKYTSTYKKKTGLPLDIVPDDNPYTVAKDGNFKVKIFFRGEPLKNTKVKVWHKLNENMSVQEYKTDDDGELKFFLDSEGQWMISCVKMERLENNAKAEWQSYWGTVTWGYY